jgi:hypothetical protein
MALRIFLDFFGETEDDQTADVTFEVGRRSTLNLLLPSNESSDVTFSIGIDSATLEDERFAREELFSRLANLIKEGDVVTLVLESAAPILEVADIYKMVTSISGHEPVLEILGSGHLPAITVKKLTF